MNAAQAWGVKSPYHFDMLPKDARLDIIAWYEATNKITAIARHDQAEKAKKEAKAKGKKK